MNHPHATDERTLQEQADELHAAFCVAGAVGGEVPLSGVGFGA